MRHRVSQKRLGRKPAHKKAMLGNMVTALFRHGRIRTTHAKARELRRTAERLITRAGTDSVHNRRMAARTVHDHGILAKLFTDIGGRYVDRPGGYTRILKLGPRYGDAAEMVILELVADEASPAPKGRPRKGRRAESAPAATTPKSKAIKPASEEAVQAATPIAAAEPPPEEGGSSDVAGTAPEASPEEEPSKS